jgi:ethanolamine ammonia-lyase large subunit
LAAGEAFGVAFGLTAGSFAKSSSESSAAARGSGQWRSISGDSGARAAAGRRWPGVPQRSLQRDRAARGPEQPRGDAVVPDGLALAFQAALSLGRGALGNNVMYFETGQGSALSAGAHHGLDQQTCEARAYGVCRAFDPLLVNTVVGFIGPEYLYDGKQIIRAGLEDHFCGKLLGLPMGCDICYTNHAEADQDDMDTLLTLLGAAGVNFIMGVPGGDDVMLNYQSTSFHDALYIRDLLGLARAPEFERWLQEVRITDAQARLTDSAAHPLLGFMDSVR